MARGFAKGFAQTFKGDSISSSIEQSAALRIKSRLKREERREEQADEVKFEADKIEASFKSRGEVLDPEDKEFIQKGGTGEEARQNKIVRDINRRKAEQGNTLATVEEQLLISGEATSLLEAEVKAKEMERNEILDALQVEGAQDTRVISKSAVAESEDPGGRAESLERLSDIGGTGDSDFFTNLRNPIDFLRGRTKKVTEFDKKITKELRTMFARGLKEEDIQAKIKEDGVTLQELKGYMAAFDLSTADALKDLGIKRSQVKE